MSDDETDGSARVVGSSEVEPDRHDHGRRAFQQYRLGHAAGGDDLGTSRYELDPGDRTWPAHYHTANEEAVHVLDGELTLWVGDLDRRTAVSLEPGDYAALPTGPDHTHEVESAGDGTARFLVVSTMREPDFTVLDGPGDRRKARLVAGDPPGEYDGRYVSRTLDFDAEVPYWEADGGEAGSENDSENRREDSEETAAVERHVVSAGDLDWSEHGPPREGHRFRRKQLGAAAGGEDLGASLYEVPPGKRTWLPHYHTGNEEAIYVLAGEGAITLGPDRVERSLSPGDYAALPAGEAGYHDIVAGSETFRYLLVSTMNEPDVTVYPEDDRVGLYAGSAPGGDGAARSLSTYLDSDAEVDYWE